MGCLAAVTEASQATVGTKRRCPSVCLSVCPSVSDVEGADGEDMQRQGLSPILPRPSKFPALDSEDDACAPAWRGLRDRGSSAAPVTGRAVDVCQLEDGAVGHHRDHPAPSLGAGAPWGTLKAHGPEEA